MKAPKRKQVQALKEKQTQVQDQNLHKPIITDLLWLSLIATFMKILLIPTYHSTDFEVHRNWLALTHTLSLPQWYSDETSPWTLDYPPLFAYFEYVLSLFASIVDPTITNLYNGLNYKAPSVIIFQRLSVIASDTVLIYSIYKLTKNLELKKKFLIWVLVIWSPSLLMVDHVHFQYNGFLFGILLVSLGALQQGNDLMGRFVFAVLLCFKHLFAVTAPVYFVYLLRHYCRGGFLRGFGRLVTMGMVVVGVFVVAFGPFAYHGQVTPLMTFVVVPLAMSPCLVKAWRNPQPKMVIRWVSYAYSCGFLFGWHVHEKASLHFSIPLAIVAVQSMEDARHYFILSIVSCYSLFPLLYEAQEYPIKTVLLLSHIALMWFGFSAQFSEISKKGVGVSKTDEFLVTGWIEKSYLVGLVGVEAWGQFLHPWLMDDRFPFLPLVSVSIYCALGLVYSWVWQLRYVIRCR